MPDIKTATGISWRYDISGEGDVLLFIHGWGVNRKIWRQQVKYFSKSFTVITIDLPGHGESTWVDVSLEDIVRDIEGILSGLSVGKISIVGSSLGGLVAFKYFDLYPDKIKKMIFVGSIPKFSQSEDYPYGLDIKKIKKLGSQLDSNYTSTIDIFFRSLFTKEERATRRFKWLQRFRNDDVLPMKSALLEYLGILENEDLRSVLTKINIPVLIVNGEEDNIAPKEAVEWMRGMLSDVSVEIFEKCGHFPFLSKAYEFNGVLDRFLE